MRAFSCVPLVGAYEKEFKQSFKHLSPLSRGFFLPKGNTMTFHVNPDCLSNLLYWHSMGIRRVLWVKPFKGGTASCYTDKGQPHWL